MHFIKERVGGELIGEVKLEVGSVADPVRKDRLAGGLGSRGEAVLRRPALLEAHHTLLTDFSMSTLYDRTLATSCPVASCSLVELVVPKHSPNSFEIHPADGFGKVTKRENEEDVVVWETRRGE